MARKQTDTSDYVGHPCQKCGQRVNVAAGGKSTPKGGSYWKRNARTGEIKAWHLDCLLGRARE